MKKSKLPPDLRYQCETDFINGMTIPALLRKYQSFGLKTSTVQSWNRKYKWVELRQDARQKLREGILAKLETAIVDHTETAMNFARIVAKLALEQLSNMFARRNEMDVETLYFRLERLTRIVLMTTNIQRNVMPEASEDVLKNAVEQLEAARVLD